MAACRNVLDHDLSIEVRLCAAVSYSHLAWPLKTLLQTQTSQTQNTSWKLASFQAACWYAQHAIMRPTDVWDLPILLAL